MDRMVQASRGGPRRREMVARAATVLAIAGLISVTGAPSASEAQEGYSTAEFNIARKDNEQIRPRVSGKYVVWQDYRNLGNVPANEPSTATADIFAKDIEANSEFSVTEKHTAARPAVSGSRVVYADSRNATDNCSGIPCGIDIRGYDIQADRAFIVSDREGDQDYPAIDGSLAVWQDHRGTDWDIRGRNIDSDEAFVVSNRTGSDQRKPAISGRIIVWEDYRKAPDQPDIWARNLDNDSVGSVTDRGDARDPAISGFWVAYRVGDPTSDNQRIRLINLATKEERAITDRIRIGSGPRISGNLVVWADMRNEEDFNIWGYDINTDKSFKVGTGDKDQTAPDISGLVTVWEDGRGDNPRDIRGARLTIPASASPTPTNAGHAAPSGPCQFILGFAFLHSQLLGLDGACVDNEHDDPNGTGDRVQFTFSSASTVQGYMVWQKVTNTMRWTDGAQTYTYSSCGLQRRANSQSFIWEQNPSIVVRGEVPPYACAVS